MVLIWLEGHQAKVQLDNDGCISTYSLHQLEQKLDQWVRGAIGPLRKTLHFRAEAKRVLLQQVPLRTCFICISKIWQTQDGHNQDEQTQDWQSSDSARLETQLEFPSLRLVRHLILDVSINSIDPAAEAFEAGSMALVNVCKAGHLRSLDTIEIVLLRHRGNIQGTWATEAFLQLWSNMVKTLRSLRLRHATIQLHIMPRESDHYFEELAEMEELDTEVIANYLISGEQAGKEVLVRV